MCSVENCNPPHSGVEYSLSRVVPPCLAPESQGTEVLMWVRWTSSAISTSRVAVGEKKLVTDKHRIMDRVWSYRFFLVKC